MNRREFEKDERIEILHMIEGNPPVTPGIYAIVEVHGGPFGSSYTIRSVPDEDIDAEVDHDTLIEAVNASE